MKGQPLTELQQGNPRGNEKCVRSSLPVFIFGDKLVGLTFLIWAGHFHFSESLSSEFSMPENIHPKGKVTVCMLNGNHVCVVSRSRLNYSYLGIASNGVKFQMNSTSGIWEVHKLSHKLSHSLCGNVNRGIFNWYINVLINPIVFRHIRSQNKLSSLIRQSIK
jgi:hypothetical protein